MKKIYLSLLTIGLTLTASAQLSLTKAFNEPALGNVHTKKGYDSVGVVPKNTGAGQNWNFSTLTTNTFVEVSTYTTVASTPSAASFPLATIAEDLGGGGSYNYWRATATQFELMGFADATSMVTFSNSAIAAIWPVNFGYTNTDAFAGTVTSGTMTGPANGTIVTNATGSGTITLPGSITLTNILQLRTNNNLVMTLPTAFGTVTISSVATDYNYYSGTQKFPVLTVSYQKNTTTTILGPTVTLSADIRLNNAVLTGITDVTIDAVNYNVYPNPATDAVNINLTNDKTEEVSVVIMNSLGQVVKSVSLGSAVEVKYLLSTSDLASGIYYIKTSVGDKSTTKKLIIQ